LDSRSGTEELGLLLRNLGIKTFVTHSSLSQEERHRTEAAFAQESDCVIVATSVLELGIDVGDLDRVIQIDAPATVAGFLQRMGRTGRRSGTKRNCLMLGIKPEKTLQAVALTELWEQGFVEPIEPPPEPYHILSQQLMALALQQGGIGGSQWFQWVQGVYGFSQFPAESIAELQAWMLENEILSETDGLLWLGSKGESKFGRRNFLELFSVFTTPPIFHVLHGRSEIGQVDESALLIKQEGPRLLSLGGRSWEVQHIDWQRKHAFVQPSDSLAITKWPGSGLGLSFCICRMMHKILCGSNSSERWSERCKTQIENLRSEFNWLRPDGLTLINEEQDRLALWTFAGAKANSVVAYYLAQEIKSHISSDGFSMKFDREIRDGEIRAGLQRLSVRGFSELKPIPNEHAIRGLKFSECLPPHLAELVGSARLRDDDGVEFILQSAIHSVITSGNDAVSKSLGTRRTNRAEPRINASGGLSDTHNQGNAH
jgi:ATP-dependent Lhr-like helicase